MDKQIRQCPECGKEGWLEAANTRTTPTPPAGQVEAVAEYEGDRATDEQVGAYLVTELDIAESKANGLNDDHWGKAYARCNAAALRRLIDIYQHYAAGEPSASPQLNTATETCGGVPDFFKQIVRKLEFSAQQSELWENPEDYGIVAIEYRALAMKLEKWIEEQSIKASGAVHIAGLVAKNDELRDALLDMVWQFCSRNDKLAHSFMSAEEHAFDVLDLDNGMTYEEAEAASKAAALPPELRGK